VECRVEAGNLKRSRKAFRGVVKYFECGGKMQRRKWHCLTEQAQDSSSDLLMLAKLRTTMHDAMANDVGFGKESLLQLLEKILCGLPGIAKYKVSLKERFLAPLQGDASRAAPNLLRRSRNQFRGSSIPELIQGQLEGGGAAVECENYLGVWDRVLPEF